MSRAMFGIAALLPTLAATPPSVPSATPTEPAGIAGGSGDANWQAALAYVEQNFYAGVFREPFDSRGEALILDNDPGSTYAIAAAQLSVAPEFVGGKAFTGYRLNEAGVCETFVLEVISADEAVPAETLLPDLPATTDSAALGAVLARNITIRALAGVLHGTAGGVPVDGVLLALDRDPCPPVLARRVALFVPLVALAWEEVELLRDQQYSLSMSGQPTIGEPPALPTDPHVSTPPSNPDWCLDRYANCLNYCEGQRSDCDRRRGAAINLGQFGCTMVCLVVGGAVGGASGGLTGAVVGAECTLVCHIIAIYVDEHWSERCQRFYNSCRRRCLTDLQNCLHGLELCF
jgi:hypothetical protein